MKRIPDVFLASMMLASLAATGTVCAEPSEGDQRLRKRMNSEPANGLVFMEVSIAEHEKPGPRLCQMITVTIKSDEGVKIGGFIAQKSPMLLGKLLDGATYGGVASIPAGNHALDEIECEGPSGIRLKGPFAKFTVQAGQILNLGNVQIVYQIGELRLFSQDKNKADWRVTDISPRAAASLVQRFPETFAKAKKQYMTAIRAAKQ